MDFLSIYTCAVLGVPAATILIIYLLRWLLFLRLRLHNVLLRSVRCVVVVSRHRYIGPLSLAQLMRTVAVLMIALVGNAIKVTDRSAITTRAGRLCVVFFAPLFASSHFGLTGHVVGAKLTLIKELHVVFGVISFLEGAVHTVLNIDRFSLDTRSRRFGLVAGVSLSLLLILVPVRTPLYETFYLSHLISGILLGIATVYHLPHTESITYWLSIGALSLLGCIFLLRVAVTISRNVSFNKGASLPLATLQSQTEQMFEISLAMTKQWNFKPGQFIYLRFPFLSREYWLVSWFQSHPFTIVSWDVPAGHSRFLAPTTIRVVAKSRMGLTQILHHISQESKTEKRPLQTIVEGPYGSFSDFSRFDTIFMVATDVGILALISHIRGVLDGLDEYATRTRFVHLIWDLQRHQDVNLAKQYIDALFEHDDKFFSLKIWLFCPDQGCPENNRFEGYAEEDVRLKTFNTSLGAVEFAEAFDNGRGRLLVAVSATHNVRNLVRGQIRCSSFEKTDVELDILDYQPPERMFEAHAEPKPGPSKTDGELG